MLHVASEATIHALNSSHQFAARPPQAAQAPATSFSSMLDDSQAAAEPPKQPKQPAADDNVRTARTDSDQPPAKTSDDKPARTDAADAGKDAQKAGKDAQKTTKTSDDKPAGTDAADAGKDAQKTVTTGVTNDVKTDVKTGVKTGVKINAKASAETDTKSDTTDQPDPAAKADQSDKPADGKAAADAKIVTTATSPDDKPTDSKPAVIALPDASGMQPIDPASVIKAPDATVAVVAPTIAPTPMPTPTAADHADTPAAKPGALAALQADSGKAADDASLTAKTATAVHGETKPQEPASNTDDDAIAHARGEPTDSGHHSFTAQVLATDATSAPKVTADIAPPTALPAPAQTSPAAAANPTAAAPLPQAAAIPLAGVAVEIASKASAGKNHFEIRLDPPELGRIEVRLAVDRDGNVTSRLIADRPDTLDLLRRDASGLERALQDAGLKTSDNGLQFSLRDQSAYQQQRQQQQGQARDTAHIVLEDKMLAAADTSQRSHARLAGLGRGLDIQV